MEENITQVRSFTLAQGRHIPEQPGFLASLRKGTSSLATGIAKTPANLKALRLGTVVPSIAVLAALAGSTSPALASGNGLKESLDETTVVSRSEDRSSLLSESVTVTSGENDTFTLSDNSTNSAVPYSQTPDQQKAHQTLQGAAASAQSTYESSSQADASTRATLKAKIDEAKGLLTRADASTADLNKAASATTAAATAARNSQASKVAAANHTAQAQNAGGTAGTGANTRQPATPSLPSTDNSPLVSGSGKGAAVVALGMQYVHKVPYVFGGETTAGWDCSGFVKWVYAHFGVNLPHSSGAQAGAGRAVPNLAAAQPGDIIANGSHAAIYIGGGKVVNAANPSQGTCVSELRWMFPGGYSIRRIF